MLKHNKQYFDKKFLKKYSINQLNDYFNKIIFRDLFLYRLIVRYFSKTILSVYSSKAKLFNLFTEILSLK